METVFRNRMIALAAILISIVVLSSCGGSPVCPTAGLQRPDLVSPADFSVVGSLDPTLSWSYPDATCHPQGYRIDLSVDRDFADTSLSGGTGNPSTSWGPGSPLDPGQEYFWKVSAINDITLGPSSVYWRFFTGPYCDPAALAAPTLVWPADGEVIDTTDPLLLYANGNAGCIPQGYGIHLSSDPTFADASLNGGTGNPDTAWAPGVDLTDCTTYYWYVFAGIDTTFGPHSATRSFYVNASGTCPAPGGGSISGLVFHDLCAVPDGPYVEVPPGCIAFSDGGLGANGVYDPGEPGIPGVHVVLGQGTCASSVILQTAVTGADGSYSFNSLPAGTYCVSADALEADNVSALIPGNWTYPMRDVNPILQAVILGADEHRAGIIFGWDYQFLPAPAVAPTQSFTPTPTLLQPFFTINVTPDHIYYRGTQCGSHTAEFLVRVADPAKTASVGLFVRLLNKGTGEATGWSEGLAMTPLGGGQYSYSLLAENVPDFTKFTDAVLQYQVVANDAAGKPFQWSDYGEIPFSVCGK
jgi:hypothetical protein